MPPISDQEQRVFAKVLQMLGSGQPTVQHLDDYIVGHVVIGRLVAMQQGIVETLENHRKFVYAQEFTKAKTAEERVSDKMAEMTAELAIGEIRTKEAKEREKLTMLRNTRESIWEAINAIKYLGKQGG